MRVTCMSEREEDWVKREFPRVPFGGVLRLQSSGGRGGVRCYFMDLCACGTEGIIPAR